MRVTPPPFWYAVFRGGVKAVRSTQRASTQYATIPLNRTQRSFFYSFYVITAKTLKTRDWQINNLN